MRISTKQYAQSLYEAVRDRKDSQVKDVIKKFAQILIENNEISKAERIIEHFEKIWNKEKGIVEAEIISIRKLNIRVVKLLNNYIIKLSKAKKVIVKEKVDKSILGGVVIKYEDKVLDGSLKMRLRELKKEMVK